MNIIFRNEFKTIINELKIYNVTQNDKKDISTKKKKKGKNSWL